jgi:hypothetical protein
MSVGDFDIDLDALRSKRRGEARFAQRWFHHMGPRDAPLLPLSNVQYYERMQGSGIEQITALYARSLALFGYKVFHHPDIEVFGSGVMASPFAPRHILDDVDLKLRFWPCVLTGLGPNLIWSPPGALGSSLTQGERIPRWPSPNSELAAPGRPVAPAVEARARQDCLRRVGTLQNAMLLDILEVPQRDRTAGTYRHLAEVMAELGWTAVRVRDFTRGGYKEQVRGYVRANRH